MLPYHQGGLAISNDISAKQEQLRSVRPVKNSRIYKLDQVGIKKD
jgi:hypothetical protein